jgi:hypothetical protein
MRFYFSKISITPLAIGILLLLLIIPETLLCQELYTISLKKKSLNTQLLNFKISEIIDARKDKNIVGVIQRGLKNKKDLAVFESPGLQEISELLQRSGVVSENSDSSIVIRVNTLYITELSRSLNESAKAELGIDFFTKLSDGTYQYISTDYSTFETRMFDVTSLHTDNIVKVIELSFSKFSKSKPQVLDKIVNYQDLIDPDFSLITKQLPILTDTVYLNGYYASFNEFIENSPSIDIGCKIRLDQGVKIKCSGEPDKMVDGIYGFAKDNKLFVLFHNDFYPLEREEDIFFFKGPKVIGPGSQAVKRGWLVAGAAGVAVASSYSGYKDIYVIELSNGRIKNFTGF